MRTRQRMNDDEQERRGKAREAEKGKRASCIQNIQKPLKRGEKREFRVRKAVT